jgi:hypothetical protein
MEDHDSGSGRCLRDDVCGWLEASPRSTTGGSRRATPTAAVSGRSVRPDRVTPGPPASGRPHRRSRRLERCRSLSARRCPADAPARGLGRAPGSRSVGGCWARQRTGLRSGRRTDRVRGTGRRSRQPRSGRAAPKTSEDGKQDRAPSHLVGLRSARRSRSMTSSRLWRTNERNDPQSAPMPPRNRTAANNRLGCRWGAEHRRAATRGPDRRPHQALTARTASASRLPGGELPVGMRRFVSSHPPRLPGRAGTTEDRGS